MREQHVPEFKQYSDVTNLAHNWRFKQPFSILVNGFGTVGVSCPEERVGFRIEEKGASSLGVDIEDLQALVSRLFAYLQNYWQLTVDFKVRSLGTDNVPLNEARLDSEMPYFKL
jgi:hypothetical protein